MIDAEAVVRRSKIVMRYHNVYRHRKIVSNLKGKFSARMHPTPPALNPLALLPKRRLKLKMGIGVAITTHSFPAYVGMMLAEDEVLARSDRVAVSRKMKKIVTLGYLTHVMMEAGYALI